MPLHADEIPIDLALVRRLVDRAFPAYAALPLRPLHASGSSNALFRLGDDLLVRLPRQPGGSATISKEQRWLPVARDLLPVAVPEVVAVGEPDLGYPERWSVVRWRAGRPPVAGAGGEVLAYDLAEVLVALRDAEVPSEALTDPALHWYRADPLTGIADDIRDALEACRGLDLGLDLDLASRVWEDGLALPPYAGRPRWLHADLLCENLLVTDGRLSAVLDLGGLAVGDPTVDLVVAWEALDVDGRAALRAAVGVDEVTWLRGRAWALALAVMTFPYYGATMPGRCADRLVMARAVLADAER